MNYRAELIETLGKIDFLQVDALIQFVKACEGTLWLAGNGGSASTAQHWACDLSKAAGRRVQALGCNTATLTAWANDESYADALSEEMHRLARPGDALICLSCSGTSDNIETLICHDMPVALVTSAKAPRYGNVLIVRVPHTHYGIIEDCHLAIGHWLTEELQTRVGALDTGSSVTPAQHCRPYRQ